MMTSTDTGSCYVGMKCTHATSLSTFKRWLEEHHPVLLCCFENLALSYETLDLVFKNTIRMCNKMRIFGTLMIVWQE